MAYKRPNRTRGSHMTDEIRLLSIEITATGA